MKSIVLILLIVCCFSCLQRKKAIISDNIEKNELYSFLNTIEDVFSANEIDGIENYCLEFIKTDLKDTLLVLSHGSYFFQDEQKSDGYKGVIKVNNLDIFIFDEHELGIKFYGDSLQVKEIPIFKKNENLQLILIEGCLENNRFKELTTHEVMEKGWVKYFMK